MPGPLEPGVEGARSEALQRATPTLVDLKAGLFVEAIEFNDALRALHGLIGKKVQVLINLPGFFFDCGFGARLERVQTLDEIGGPVLMVFGENEGIAIEPAELKAYRAGSAGSGEWLEFHLGQTARLVIEPREGQGRLSLD